MNVVIAGPRLAIALPITVGVAGALVWILLLLKDVVADLVKSEVRAWLPHISRAIVRRAARALPDGHHDFLEVWESDLEDYEDRPLTMLAVAICIARDRGLIAEEIGQAELKPSLTPSPPRLRWRIFDVMVVETVRGCAATARTVPSRIATALGRIGGALAVRPLLTAVLYFSANLVGLMYLPESKTGFLVMAIALGVQAAILIIAFVRLFTTVPELPDRTTKLPPLSHESSPNK